MTAPTLPICERLRRDFDGEPFDTAICRDVNALCGTTDALYEALEGLAIMAGKLVVRADGKFQPERRAVLDAMILAETTLSLAREGATHDQQ